jgi:putative phosphoesterase
MRIAVLSDIHGNEVALDSVLTDIERQNVDQVICLGDFVDPLPGSQRIWQLLKKMSIPIIRGNHEDYVIDFFRKPEAGFRLPIQFEPIRSVAELFSDSEINELALLPLQIPTEKILFCHASPRSNLKGYLNEIDDELKTELLAVSQEIIICGHWHHIFEKALGTKRLLAIGSVGIPLNGKTNAEYAILSREKAGWKIENHAVPYDVEQTLREFRESGFLQRGAPVTWLYYDELLTANRKLGPFFQELRSQNLQNVTKEELKSLVQSYLMRIGRWDIKRY